MASKLGRNTEDLIECAICTEMYKTPKMLPCKHTFCLDCLQACAGNKSPGSVESCPLCRQEFEIPRGGVKMLQDNDFSGKLTEISRTSNSNTAATKIGDERDSKRKGISETDIQSNEEVSSMPFTEREKLLMKQLQDAIEINNLQAKLIATKLSGEATPTEYLPVPVLTHTIETGKGVIIIGMTLMADEVFLLLRSNHSKTNDVQVYDCNTLTLQRRLPIDVHNEAVDMTSSSNNSCLYIGDSYVKSQSHGYGREIRESCIHRIELIFDKIKKSSWQVQHYNPIVSCLSIACDGSNLLVICPDNQGGKIIEYTTHGDVVRELQLIPDYQDPYHVLPMPNGQFIVTQYSRPYTSYQINVSSRVCLVDKDGYASVYYPTDPEVIKTMSGCQRLATDKNGIILATCSVITEFTKRTGNSECPKSLGRRDQKTVVLLSPSMNYIRTLITRNGCWQQPRMMLDEARGRLFLSDIDMDNVLVFTVK